MKVAVIGASGYVGAELVGLLCQHDKIEISHLIVSEQSTSCGKTFAELFPRWQGICDLPLQSFSSAWFDKNAADLDAVFFATPHEFSHQWAAKFIAKDVQVFDLSGAFRIKDKDVFEQAYGFSHHFSDELETAVYGLAEWQQDEIFSANLIAVPGCYPTASLLALKPITCAQLNQPNSLIVVNGISGVSGAGRKASLATSFNEVSLTPYNILGHRHQPEISQECANQVIFNPHLAPYKRGLLSTVTLSLKPGVTQSDVEHAFTKAYQDEPLVRLQQSWPKIDNVAYTPFADIHYKYDAEKRVLVVSCAIDNLLKGAASQAIQCVNIQLGLSSEYSLLSRAQVSNIVGESA